MAFQQPQKRPHHPRHPSYAAQGDEAESSSRPGLQRASTRRTVESTEEWVLFTPGAPSQTATHTTSTDRTPRTAALSRLSDFGSLDTAARSDQVSGVDEENETEHGTDVDEETELDSLDDGLHAFHDPEYGTSRSSLHQPGDTVLPTHDGLGTFGGISDAIQTQLWQYEARRRHRRRASSVQRTLEALEETDNLDEELERMRRIERWRLEQSRALLEEIERETRRMRRVSRASARSRKTESVAPSEFQTKSEYAFSSGVATPAIMETPEPASDQLPVEPEENEGFWRRITRRVIRDLIGIDEELLSVILGETLPEEARESPIHSTDDITRDKYLENAEGQENAEGPSLEGETWQHRLLERVARELGLLVNQLSEHPGAFSTYRRALEPPPYAGMTHSLTSVDSNAVQRNSAGNAASVSPSADLFAPTLQPHGLPDPSLWGIEEEEPVSEAKFPNASTDEVKLEKEREYWERELDIKMVFNFLKDKFSSRPSSPEPIEQTVPYVGGYMSPTKRPSAYSTSSAHRSALIRQHHPLALRAEGSRRKEALNRHLHAAPISVNLMRQRLGVRPRSDSCASQSTKRSRKSGSSRNYWDIGGSVGSGQAGISTWGEVGI